MTWHDIMHPSTHLPIHPPTPTYPPIHPTPPTYLSPPSRRRTAVSSSHGTQSCPLALYVFHADNTSISPNLYWWTSSTVVVVVVVVVEVVVIVVTVEVIVIVVVGVVVVVIVSSLYRVKWASSSPLEKVFCIRSRSCWEELTSRVCIIIVLIFCSDSVEDSIADIAWASSTTVLTIIINKHSNLLVVIIHATQSYLFQYASSQLKSLKCHPSTPIQ